MDKPWYKYVAICLLAVLVFLLIHWMFKRDEPRRLPTEFERECERMALMDTMILGFVWAMLLFLFIPFPKNGSGMQSRIIFTACFYVFYRLDFILRKKYKFLK